jgi:hypothetical protein
MEGGKLIKRLKSHEAAKKFTKQDGGENDQRPEAPCLQPTSAALRAGQISLPGALPIAAAVPLKRI